MGRVEDAAARVRLGVLGGDIEPEQVIGKVAPSGQLASRGSCVCVMVAPLVHGGRAGRPCRVAGRGARTAVAARRPSSRIVSHRGILARSALVSARYATMDANAASKGASDGRRGRDAAQAGHRERAGQRRRGPRSGRRRDNRGDSGRDLEVRGGSRRPQWRRGRECRGRRRACVPPASRADGDAVENAEASATSASPPRPAPPLRPRTPSTTRATPASRPGTPTTARMTPACPRSSTAPAPTHRRAASRSREAWPPCASSPRPDAPTRRRASSSRHSSGRRAAHPGAWPPSRGRGQLRRHPRAAAARARRGRQADRAGRGPLPLPRGEAQRQEGRARGAEEAQREGRSEPYKKLADDSRTSLSAGPGQRGRGQACPQGGAGAGKRGAGQPRLQAQRRPARGREARRTSSPSSRTSSPRPDAIHRPAHAASRPRAAR